MRDDRTVEIERKFLVAGDGWRDGVGAPISIRQGYLARTATCVVRIRTSGDRASVAVKGAQAGLTRREFEYEIPPAHAEAMFALCDGALIEKTRYAVEHDRHTWSIDVFSGANAGLVVAEIELESEEEPFERPPWLGAEVSADRRFRNSELSLRPYDAATRALSSR